MPPGDIKVDEGFIREVQAELTRIRDEIPQVKAGVNPGDTSHPHGMHFVGGTGGASGFQILAGGDNFAAGASLEARISALAAAVDEKLSAYDEKLSGYAQGLAHVIATSDSTEEANSSYAAFEAYLTGSTQTPTPEPPTP